MRRDRLVIESAFREGARGHRAGRRVRRGVEDTVTIHANTAKVAKEALEAVGWKR